MEALFTFENLGSLLMLILLQAVLGFDNLLYISLESGKAPKEKQQFVRTMGISLAIVLRIGLLFLLTGLVKYFQNPLFEIHWDGIISYKLNLYSIIVLFGGGFIIYTSIKEIWHMIALDDIHEDKKSKKTVANVIFWIVLMNLVFSFDSILSAMALTDEIWVMTTAIIISGILMIWLSGRVASFLKKNRMYEVLGLFVLFIVGIMLLTEGGHEGHIQLLDNPITPMSKTTFYFILFILVVIDIVQGKYQKKILKEQEREITIGDEIA